MLSLLIQKRGLERTKRPRAGALTYTTHCPASKDTKTWCLHILFLFAAFASLKYPKHTPFSAFLYVL